MLLDQLVGAGEQGLRNGESESVCSLEIDDELEARCLHDGQVGRFLALEYASSMESCFSANLSVIRTVTHQSTGSDKFAPFIECRNPITRGERDESLADHLEKQICRIENR